ncbi:hypothetical protein GPECTOR_15g484 [Gonium pectorale]|uniref:Uncharacterized protein n=1 Tax=Gonium pectorale TaxID=33097 RepID=A0A150GLZ7_GONPE|nr:hypothetical protein GPECTOR_15g484 [Gonium pectorale]|eukprot:KXZ50798.1 hypothetical protein GPECTOR_15g484 [Gonium pectorale]
MPVPEADVPQGGFWATSESAAASDSAACVFSSAFASSASTIAQDALAPCHQGSRKHEATTVAPRCALSTVESLSAGLADEHLPGSNHSPAVTIAARGTASRTSDFSFTRHHHLSVNAAPVGCRPAAAVPSAVGKRHTPAAAPSYSDDSRLPPHYAYCYDCAWKMGYDHPAAAAYAEFWSAVRSSQPQPPAANASAALPGKASGAAELAGVLRRAELAEAAASLLASRLRDERAARSLRAFEARAARERASAAAEALRREKAARAALQRQVAKERAEKEALEERATELERLLKAEMAAGEAAQRPAHSEAPRVVSCGLARPDDTAAAGCMAEWAPDTSSATVRGRGDQSHRQDASCAPSAAAAGDARCGEKAASSSSSSCASCLRATGDLPLSVEEIADPNSEHELLLVALGAEASKVAALAGALREAGVDPDALIGRLEEEWERDDAGCRH